MAENKLRKNRSKVIAIDLGGTLLRAAIVKNGKISNYIKKQTSKQQNELLKEISDVLRNFLDKEKNIKAICLGSPGPLDSEKGIIKNPPNLPFRNFNLKRYLEKKFKKRVEIENDANCVAIAEKKFGLGKNKKNFIVLTLGTGIGGGIIIDKKLYVGKNYGGELGQIILDNSKTMEYLWKQKKQDVKNLIKQKNRKQVEKTSEYLGQGIASLINIFDPEIVILSGGVKETGKVFLSKIKKYVKRYQKIPRNTEVRWTKLNHSGLLGASLLAE